MHYLSIYILCNLYFTAFKTTNMITYFLTARQSKRPYSVEPYVHGNGFLLN